MSNVVNTSAGVYISTIDQSQIPVESAQVSVGAIVLFSKQGPVDQVTKITGSKQFLTTFGVPDAKVSLAHYCALQALSYMNTIYVTRVHNNAKFGGLTVRANSNKLEMAQFTTPKLVDPEDPNKFYYDGSDTDFNVTNDVFYVYGSNPGSHNGDIRISISGVMDTASPNNPSTFKLQVMANNSGRVLETWTISRNKQVDGYGRQQYLEDIINGKSKYIRVMDNKLNDFSIQPSAMPTSGVLSIIVNAPISASTNAQLSTGDSGLTHNGGPIPINVIPTILNGTDPFPVAIGSPPIPVKNSGWQLYYDREDVGFDLLLNGGYTYPSVQNRMLDVCNKRGDCFAILDIPFDKQGNKYDATTDPIDYRNNPYGGLNADSCNGALYTPWFDILDPYNGQVVAIPPSGHVAAIYCATDINFATWFAPAGLKRGLLETVDPNFIGTGVIYKQTARDEFESAQINCTRIVRDVGVALWSEVTLQRQESAMSNVNVVRLLKLLTKIIDKSLLYSVFDPNDAILRSEISQRLKDLLEPIRLGRGLYDYDVVCSGPDEMNSNNSYDDIARGDLNVDVYLQPVIPAKRIIVKLIVNKAGVSIGSATTTN